MRRAFAIFLMGAAALAGTASAQTVDELIAKNVEARGGLEKLKAVQSLRATGTMTMGPGLQAPVTMEMKRPGRLRREIVIQGNTAVQAYDGQNGWQISPFGKKEPEPMTADDIKDMQEESDIDGPLVDYKAKGNTVELAGKEPVEGSEAYKLKVTLKNGDVRYLYLDAETFLEVKSEARRTIRGSEMEIETLLGDYKEVGGLMYPHSFQSTAKGRPEKQNVTVDKFELNPTLDDARFAMPKPTAPPSDAPKKD
jgi:outer membrane lipoprotein-sorting protein